MPYTYLLGWSKHQMFYYGVRYAKDACPEDLWVSYKTSSIYVKEFVDVYGDPDIIQVRKVFTTILSAKLWESKVLKRIGAVKREDFLNKTDNVSYFSGNRPGVGNSFYNKKHSDQTKLKIISTKKNSPKVCCSKCNKYIDVGNFNRWHGENCGVGISSGTTKRIKCQDKIFDILGDAAKYFGVSNATITYRVKSKNFDYELLGV